MPERIHINHEEYVEQQLRNALDVTRQALQSGTGLLLAACRLSTILHTVPELERKIQPSDFLFLKGVDSECDGLPLGPERQYWAPASLREKDAIAQSYEQAIREDLVAAFTRIADSLSSML